MYADTQAGFNRPLLTPRSRALPPRRSIEDVRVKMPQKSLSSSPQTPVRRDYSAYIPSNRSSLSSNQQAKIVTAQQPSTYSSQPGGMLVERPNRQPIFRAGYTVGAPAVREQPAVIEQPVNQVQPEASNLASYIDELPAPRKRLRPSRLQFAIYTMAVTVLITGATTSFLSLKTNKQASAGVAAISKKVDTGPTTTESTKTDPPPSTTKPSAKAYHAYGVAPELPRYLRIPKLGINARVLQVGTKASGELATPTNVFDTAWYTGSSRPGDPGATLIDGHVSSWSSHGVFYGIKKLVGGDSIQIQKGDGAVLYYRVVKVQVYDADNVDMQSAMTPITPGKSGLNLITCSGQYESGTHEFNQRVIVFAEQV